MRVLERSLYLWYLELEPNMCLKEKKTTGLRALQLSVQEPKLACSSVQIILTWHISSVLIRWRGFFFSFLLGIVNYLVIFQIFYVYHLLGAFGINEKLV